MSKSCVFFKHNIALKYDMLDVLLSLCCPN